jgi:hypothetical protein
LIGLLKREYLQKAKELSESDSKNLVSRIGRHYFDELTRAGFPEVAMLALLLERDGEQLNEWRQAVDKIRAGELPVL